MNLTIYGTHDQDIPPINGVESVIFYTEDQKHPKAKFTLKYNVVTRIGDLDFLGYPDARCNVLILTRWGAYEFDHVTAYDVQPIALSIKNTQLASAIIEMS